MPLTVQSQSPRPLGFKFQLMAASLATPTSATIRQLRVQGLKIAAGRVLFIQRVFYGGDDGGIMCDVTPTKDAKSVIVISLTHLRIAPNHPLAHDIRAYQRERVRRIALSNR